MALTGELSDLSLAELIEFFCNQRKTGCIEVQYTTGSAAFFLQSGAVIHAEVGTLRGIEAVYFALTQTNASFTFNSAIEAPVHTINQPWTSVVLEGLRRMDEGIAPPNPFPAEVARPMLQDPVKDQPIAGLVTETAKEQPIAVEAAEVIDAEPPLVSAFDEPQVESIDVLDSEPEPVASAPKEVPPASVPIIEAYPRPIVAARQEVNAVPLPVVEVKTKPIVSAPKPAASVPATHQAAQANSVPAEQKQQVEKKEKPVDAVAFDVEPAGILSYHPKPAPPKVSPIFAESASSGFNFGPWKLSAVFAAVVLVIAVVAVPWGWYARSKAAKLSSDTQKVTTDARQLPVAVNSIQDSQTQSGPGNQAASVSQTSATETNNVPTVGSDTRPAALKEVRPKPKNTESALVTSQPPAAS